MTYSMERQTQTDMLPSNWLHYLAAGRLGALENMTTITQRYQGPSGQGTLAYACYPPGIRK